MINYRCRSSEKISVTTYCVPVPTRDIGTTTLTRVLFKNVLLSGQVGVLDELESTTDLAESADPEAINGGGSICVHLRDLWFKTPGIAACELAKQQT